MQARVLDKSSEAVNARLRVLFEEAEHRINEHDAKMAREEKRPKLSFPDPLAVGLNLPFHLVGDSADYRTKKRLPGVNKYGFTSPEVSHTNKYTRKRTYIHERAFAFSFSPQKKIR